MSEARATHWQPDPLLARTPARTPNFVRMPWDENNAQAFGPWRMQDKTDPTGPQTEPAKNFSPSPAPADNSAEHDAASGAAAPDAGAPPHDTSPNSMGGASGAAAAGAASSEAAAAATGTATVVVGGASEQELTVARQQGYVLGIKDGLSKALNDLEAERQKEREAIRSLMIELRALEQNPQRFFEPLRRLALHLAEQLVRGELTVSGQAIDRLVKSCLDDLGSHDKAVVVTLNPDDLQRLQALQIDTQSELRLDPDPTLLPGSVRVRAHDAEIQDFIDHRLEALARRLLSDPEAWLKKSSLLHPHEVEPLPDDTPKRPWFTRPVDVQDTPSKPVATAEQAEAADAPTERDAAATGAQALDETVPPEDAAPALPAAEALPSPAPDAAAAAQDASDSTPPPAKGHKPPAPKPDPEPSA